MKSKQEYTEDRILRFFDINKDEELAVSDAVAKFEISQGTATTILNRLATRGLLKKTVEQISRYQGRSIYSRA